MKDLNYYLTLPYTVVLRPDPDGGVVARVEELPGCSTDGPTVTDAVDKLDDLKRAWIEDALEAGHAVPEPSPEEDLPSGKWVQRVPRSLHRKLSITAKKEGVSLNTFVSTLLSEAIGARRDRNIAVEGSVAPAVPTEQHLAGSSWHDTAAFWHDALLHTCTYTIVTNHPVHAMPEPLGLANRLHLLGAGFPKSCKKPFKVFHDEEKSHTLRKA